MRDSLAESTQPTKEVDLANEPALTTDDSSVGLTDDERVSREKDTSEGGARVEPGPADAERLPKP